MKQIYAMAKDIERVIGAAIKASKREGTLINYEQINNAYETERFLLAMMAAVALALGMTGCSSEDNAA